MTQKEQDAQNLVNDTYRDIHGVTVKTAVSIPTRLYFASKVDAQDFVAWAKSVHYSFLDDDKLPRNKSRVAYTVNHMISVLSDNGKAKYSPEWSEIRRLADAWREEVSKSESRLDADILVWEQLVQKANKNLNTLKKFKLIAPEEVSDEDMVDMETQVADNTANLHGFYRMANKRAEKAKKELPYPTITDSPDSDESEENDETKDITG